MECDHNQIAAAGTALLCATREFNAREQNAWLDGFTDESLKTPDGGRTVNAWQPKEFGHAVITWYQNHGRKDLPWQLQISPYRVWVSEIMLQQTQVAVVIPYFLRFMESFPNLDSLSNANQDEVLHGWAGLGYYARARNLHRAAQRIQQEYGGQFPDKLDDLCALPGIGRSTASAILSFAFHQPHCILDGNVKRVLARCFAVAGWAGQSRVLRKLWKLSSLLTTAALQSPSSHPASVAAYNQGMMDLGATVCGRTKPDCQHCPLASHCIAYKADRIRDYPSPRKKASNPSRHRRWLVVRNPNGELLLHQRPTTGIWGGLWSFPEMDLGETASTWCLRHLGIEPERVEKLPGRRHSFSHFDLDIVPEIVLLNRSPSQIAEQKHRVWFGANEVHNLALPAPVKRLLDEVLGDNSRESSH